LVEINKNVDESEEDASNGTNNDNGLFGNSDKHNCNQLTEHENDQWIVEHMIEGVSSPNTKLHLWKFLSCSNHILSFHGASSPIVPIEEARRRLPGKKGYFQIVSGRLILWPTTNNK